MKHSETHRTHRIGWLRAAVLGANDGIVSTASLIVGVAAAESGRSSVLVAGLAGNALVAKVVRALGRAGRADLDVQAGCFSAAHLDAGFSFRAEQLVSDEARGEFYDGHGEASKVENGKERKGGGIGMKRAPPPIVSCDLEWSWAIVAFHSRIC